MGVPLRETSIHSQPALCSHRAERIVSVNAGGDHEDV